MLTQKTAMPTELETTQNVREGSRCHGTNDVCATAATTDEPFDTLLPFDPACWEKIAVGFDGGNQSSDAGLAAAAAALAARALVSAAGLRKRCRIAAAIGTVSGTRCLRW